jgi:hypothetical protein
MGNLRILNFSDLLIDEVEGTVNCPMLKERLILTVRKYRFGRTFCLNKIPGRKINMFPLAINRKEKLELMWTTEQCLDQRSATFFFIRGTP